MKNFLRSVPILFLAIVLLFITGCESEDSENVEQDRIYALYELFYNENENLTLARTTFYFGNPTGTKLELSGGASITFDGEALSYNPTLAYYELAITGPVSSGTFVYTDLDGNTFTNPVAITAVDFPAGQATTLDKSEPYEIAWEGSALVAGESVTVSLVPNAVSETKLFLQVNIGATSIVLTPGRLADIESTVGQLVMDRFTSSEPAQATSAGGEVVGHYRAPNLSVDIL